MFIIMLFLGCVYFSQQRACTIFTTCWNDSSVNWFINNIEVSCTCIIDNTMYKIIT